MKPRKIKSGSQSSSISVFTKIWKKRRWILSSIGFIVGIAVALYPTEIRGLVDDALGWGKHQFAKAPKVEVRRSLFNHEFLIVKSSMGKDSIIVWGNATTHQLLINVTNLEEDDLYVKSVELIDSSGSILLYRKGFPGGGELVKTAETKPLQAESPSLFGRDDLVKLFGKGNLRIRPKTNFKTFTYPLDCICFANGSELPNGRYLYILGKDTSCKDFELKDPNGLWNQGNPHVAE